MIAHQKLIKEKYLATDLATLGKDKAWVESLTANDFTIRIATTDADLARAKAFTSRYEWLGGPPKRGYNPVVVLVEEKSTGALAGVTWFVSPNHWSKLPEGISERLLARGATVSWSPVDAKGRPWLGTWMTTRAIDLLIQQTGSAVYVSGYADPEAGEQGGIYKASNWKRVKCKAGTIKMYYDPQKPKLGWFSDRKFRIRSSWQRYGKQLGVTNQIVWRAKTPNGKVSWTPDWTKTPPDVVQKLKKAADDWQARCRWRIVPPKQRYAIVRGRTRSETRRLRKALGWETAKPQHSHVEQSPRSEHTRSI